MVTNNAIDYTITAIAQYAFQSKSLTNIGIPIGVVSIGGSAFQDNLLTSVVIPDTVLTIGALAFLNNSLTNVSIGNSVTDLGVGAFSGNQISSIVLPNSLTNIGNNAFFNNQLSSITLPPNVIIIGTRAFVNNPLTTVITEAISPPSVTHDVTGTSDTFAYNRNNVNLIIPNGTTSAYNVYAWSDFNSVTESTLSTSNFELNNEITLINTTNELKIISSGSAQLINYNIYNLTGAKVKEGKENNIAIESFSKGIYILELNFDKGNLPKKFVK